MAGEREEALAWAASAWHLKDRDEWIDWDPLTRACRLKLIVSNWRFLVFEATRRPNLASQCLGAALRALPEQWQAIHGYRPLLAESFTNPESHAGTCFKATNWTPLGISKGFSRHYGDYYVPNDRPKKLWGYELHPEPGKARKLLCARPLPPEHAAGETDGASRMRAPAIARNLALLRSVLLAPLARSGYPSATI
ncbi:MAG: DUF4338 domain-containing protein [Verrucomicrobiales bacterium]